MMTLQEITKMGYRYKVGVKPTPRESIEVIVNGEEKMVDQFVSYVTILVYDTKTLVGVNQDPTIICDVGAIGKGKTQRAAERDGIKECLTRIVL